MVTHAAIADALDNAAALAVAELVAVIRDKSASIRERLHAAATVLRFRHAEHRAAPDRGSARSVREGARCIDVPQYPAAHGPLDVPPPPPAGEVAESARPEGVGEVPSAPATRTVSHGREPPRQSPFGDKYSHKLAARIMQLKAEAEARRRADTTTNRAPPDS